MPDTFNPELTFGLWQSGMLLPEGLTRLQFRTVREDGGGPPPPSFWILQTGFWDDLGVWDDSANWID